MQALNTSTAHVASYVYSVHGDVTCLKSMKFPICHPAEINNAKHQSNIVCGFDRDVVSTSSLPVTSMCCKVSCKEQTKALVPALHAGQLMRQ